MVVPAQGSAKQVRRPGSSSAGRHARLRRQHEEPAVTSLAPYDPSVLPGGIRSRFVERVNGLRVHILEAGDKGRPLALLLHGFPEIAYSWRKVMPALAGAGFHVIAPDQRGYGETTGWDNRYDTGLEAFRVLNLVEDAAALVKRLGLPAVHVVGHDFGSPVAACCAMLQPRVFRSVVLMSAPVGGVPVRSSRVHEELAALGRKHYQWYYSTREADANMRRAPQGLAAFLRAY